MIRIGEKFLTGYKSNWADYTEVFVNPTKKELSEAAGNKGAVRFIAIDPGEIVYITNVDMLHIEMSKAVFDDFDEIENIVMEGVALTGVAQESGGEFIWIESDLFNVLPKMAEDDPGLMELLETILEKDWSWVNRYIYVDDYLDGVRKETYN